MTAHLPARPQAVIRRQHVFDLPASPSWGRHACDQTPHAPDGPHQRWRPDDVAAETRRLPAGHAGGNRHEGVRDVPAVAAVSGQSPEARHAPHPCTGDNHAHRRADGQAADGDCARSGLGPTGIDVSNVVGRVESSLHRHLVLHHRSLHALRSVLPSGRLELALQAAALLAVDQSAPWRARQVRR
jgi:hypothetical protein